MSDQSPDAEELTVIVDDERAEPSVAGSADGCWVDVSVCRSLVADVLDHEGFGDRSLEVHVHLVDEEPMALLYAKYMGGEGPTDVLSFPVDDPPRCLTVYRCCWATSCSVRWSPTAKLRPTPAITTPN